MSAFLFPGGGRRLPPAALRRLVFTVFIVFIVPARSFAADFVDEVKRQYITVLNKGTFTLWGVNMPPDPGKRFYTPATMTLRAYLERQKVGFYPAAARTARFEVRGHDVGLQLIRMGLGWHDPTAPPATDPLHDTYAAAEREAKAHGLGVWSEGKTPSAVEEVPRKRGKKRRR